ncbi:MAG: hypothetical protein B6D44_15480 [Ignavibacteriales bacterium UTCHB2]|jgi:ligand-binding sensor domain-containing protein|nr:MAG: Sensor histidine kinase LiaS [Ignavibacteria bacterium ADurb.Bin266]OQY70625.1 MAG: hypothetical protein B6D44_15480 [Ignavibacteriales bacterium UTCHB2]HQI41677.1 two-component regulator propeller domain-containing protein [Ignavibacteriaceae bacterium]
MNIFDLKKLLLLFAICLIYTSILFAQSVSTFTIQKIDEEKGLSDNNIQCIYKDLNNFMWVGTAFGLNLIDGSDITIFKNKSDDPHSISNNSVTAIAEDNNGKLWIGTQQGLNSFDPVIRQFIRIFLSPEPNVQKEQVTDIAIDEENNILVATSSGLFYYDQKNSKISYLEIPGKGNEKISNNNITHIAFDKNGLLWISSYNGLWTYNQKSHQFNHEISQKNDPKYSNLFTCFIIDHLGKIWVGTWDNGIKKFDPLTKRLSTYMDSKFIDPINCLAEIKQSDNSYNILINGNCYTFDEQQERLIERDEMQYQKIKTAKTILYVSSFNQLWMGTKQGVYFSNLSKKFVNHLKFPKAITSQGVPIFEYDNKLLIGGEGKYFLRAYDKNLNEIDEYKSRFTKLNVSCLSIKNIGNNKIECGTSDGVAEINFRNHSAKFFHIHKNPNHSSTNNFITTLLKDNNQNIWLFPWRNGIWIADSSFKRITQIINNIITDYDVPKPLVIADACLDKNNNIWLSDLDEGIIFYDRKLNKFTKPFAKIIGERISIPQLLIRNNECFAFTGTTLFQWNVDSIFIHKIDLSSKIEKPITAITFDNAGNLWLATLNGLFVYNLVTKQIIQFTIADGLLSNEMNGTLYCMRDGTIIFGCPNYLSAFQPEKMLLSIKSIPQIKIVEMIVNGSPYRYDALHKMEFNYNVNNLTFRWAVTDYNNPLNNHYYYQLKGIDNQWRSTNGRGEVSFTNLAPDDYTLLLKGENSNGIRAADILQINFKVLPPFWLTIWFMAILFCCISGIFYLLYRYRLNQHLKLEKLRNRISIDLHDDIGSTLSSISILSDIVLHRKKEGDFDSKKIIRQINESSHYIMEKMDDIVWSINPKNDSLEDLFARMKNIASRLFEAKEINYEINISPYIKNIHLSMEHRQHIYLIMKEAINNLIKYSDCSDAEISVSYQSHIMRIIIKDNGKGYDAQKSFYGNGLISMKKRAEAINANIEILSTLNKGTELILSVKIK